MTARASQHFIDVLPYLAKVRFVAMGGNGADRHPNPIYVLHGFISRFRHEFQMDKTQPPSLYFGGRLVTPFNASLICHRNANEFDMEKGLLKSVERPALGCRILSEDRVANLA